MPVSCNPTKKSALLTIDPKIRIKWTNVRLHFPRVRDIISELCTGRRGRWASLQKALSDVREDMDVAEALMLTHGRTSAVEISASKISAPGYHDKDETAVE